MKQMMLAAGLAVIAGQASALSCMWPDVADTFGWAAEADESYIVLLGQFDFEAVERPSIDQTNPAPITVPAAFDGQYLGASGFVDAPALDVALTLSCAGPWCASLSPEAGAMLAFVEQTDAGYELSVGPCYGNVFIEPSREDIARVEACMRGEACEPAF